MFFVARNAVMNRIPGRLSADSAAFKRAPKLSPVHRRMALTRSRQIRRSKFSLIMNPKARLDYFRDFLLSTLRSEEDLLAALFASSQERREPASPLSPSPLPRTYH